MFVLVLHQESSPPSPSESPTQDDPNQNGNGTSFKATSDESSNSSSKPLVFANVISITEIPVQYPTLAISITDARWRPYKRWKHDHMHDNIHALHGNKNLFIF